MKLIDHNGLYDLPILEVSCLVLVIKKIKSDPRSLVLLLK